MIVRMKKVTLVCLASDQKSTLDSLRDLGVMHLTPVREPQSQDIDRARAHLQKAESAITILEGLKPAKGAELEDKSSLAANAAMNKVHELIHRQRAITDKLSGLNSERDLVEPFGNFDPSILTGLADKGVIVKLYSAPVKDAVEAPEGVDMFPLNAGKSSQYFALVGRSEFEFDGDEAILPERPLSAINAAIAEASADMEEIDKELLSLTTTKDVIAASTGDLQGVVEYAVARDGMESTDRLSYLQGYCPADLLDEVRAKATDLGWGLVIDEPADDDRAPTLVRNPPWIEPIKAVFDMIDIVPGYDEIDISAVFLLFFSIFFAMLVGDAGYGLIFLVMTIAARCKFKTAPAYPFRLLGLLSFCTIGWGVITGNYFGIASIWAPLKGVRIDWLNDESNIIGLCFLLGAIHLTIAHAWNAIRVANSTKALAQLGWIALTWTMYFAARAMILDIPFPSFGNYLLTGGLVVVALFMTGLKELKTEWPNHVMLPLSVISNFVDVVSYVRLFAVGSASLAVAAAFNEMAVGNGIHSVGAGIGAALILFLGHALNIILAAMGILVHGVRLNTLEFSGHIGMQWTGVHYKPFGTAPEQTAEPKT